MTAGEDKPTIIAQYYCLLGRCLLLLKIAVLSNEDSVDHQEGSAQKVSSSSRIAALSRNSSIIVITYISMYTIRASYSIDHDDDNDGSG